MAEKSSSSSYRKDLTTGSSSILSSSKSKLSKEKLLTTEPTTPSSSNSPKQRKKGKSSESTSQKDSPKSLIVNTTATTSKSSDEVTSSEETNLHKTLRQKSKKSQKKDSKKLRKKLEKQLNQSSETVNSKRSAKSKALEAISSLTSKIDSKLSKNSKQTPAEEIESSEEEEEEFVDLIEEEEEDENKVEEPIEIDIEEPETEEKTNSKKSKRRSSVNVRSRRSSRTSNNSNQLNDSEEIETESYKSRLRRPSSSSNKSTSKLTEPSIQVKKIKLSNTPISKEPESKLKKLNQKSFSFSSATSSNESSVAPTTKSSTKETGSCATKSSTLTRRSTATTSTATATAAPTTSATTTNQTLFDSSSFFSKFKPKNKMSQQNEQKPESSSSSTTNNSTAQPKNPLSLIESESSDTDNTNEFSRLTDLLQSRGLPSHIVNAFGSKVQQFIHRTMSSGISGRFQQLITSLQSPDETVKLTALTELSQLLVMGNEDTLVGFPIKQAVPLLLQCMGTESENFDLMNHACRTLTYMMESLPRSTSIIAEGIGTFLEKLNVIQCMDVAEQSLTALEILSRRHSKQILNATANGSVNACLTFIDFFSITAQRNALQITANCCQNMIKEEFVNIKPSLPILSQRLTHTDKKSVESVCTVFARLVENFQHDAQILNEIAQNSVLQNLIQLLVVQPPLVSTSMFVTILHTIYLMCSNCTDLAIVLLDSSIEQCLKQLLIGVNKTGKNFEILSSRSPQELYEIVSIIGEILPKLPQNGIFSIDETLRKASMSHQNDSVIWHWKDENEILRPYTSIDSKIIEAAYIQEEDECILNTMGRTYVIDFNSMLQINEETGTARPVSRKVLGKNEQEKKDVEESVELKDSRKDYMLKNPAKISSFISSLFQIVYEVYNSSAGPSIKHKSLRTLLRMIFFACPLNDKSDSNNNTEENLLSKLLRDLPISSHIASMLASQDSKIIVAGLQIADLLIQNLPDVFSIYFYREGVIYQIDKLIETGEKEEPRKTRSSKNQPITTTKPKQGKTGEKRKIESADLIQQNKEFVRKWILDQAKNFKKNFMSLKVSKSQSSILDQLVKLSQDLNVKEVDHNYLETLKNLNNILKKTDISSFEMIHSNLIEKLENFLCVQEPSIEFNFDQNRLKNYTKLNLLRSSYLSDLQIILNNELNCLRPKQFLNVFNSKMLTYYFTNNTQLNEDSQMALLVSKLQNCVNQLEQFAVRVHDIPNSIGSGKNAMKFFTTHQIKCMLQRHPQVPQNSSLRQWKGTHVKVDPLALVSTIEKYLLMRGIHKPQASSATSSNISSSLPSTSTLVKKPDTPKTKSKTTSETEGPSTSKNKKNKSQKKSKKDEDESDSDNEDVEIEDDFNEESEEHNFDEEDDEHIIEDNIEDEELLDEDEDEDEEDDDEDDIESAMSVLLGSSNSSRFSSLSGGARSFFSTGLNLGLTQLPKLELLINDQVLPSNMTIYQAIKQFTSLENENDLENSLLNNAIWSKVHLIHYRLANNNNNEQNDSDSKKNKTQLGSKEKTPESKPSVPSDLNQDITKTIFYKALNNKKIIISQTDKSLESIKCLSQLNILNRSWFKMYINQNENNLLLNPIDFCNQKLTAKANRQLQDPLIIMTGHLPKWLPELMNQCPFLFPFETRLMFFYQNSLDRDRAMQKLIDLNSDLLSNNNQNSNQSQADRFKPKLEKKKRQVNRSGDLIKQADLILNEFSTDTARNQKAALLEIQYENEVGTGLGPTLEFYALVSKELQKSEHEMWRGDKIKTTSGDEYYSSSQGLYPMPIFLNPNGKQSSKLTTQINKQKSKFKFMGKFMAKAAQDFRVLDIHLSPVFYKWLLEDSEKTIQEEDLKFVDEQLYNSVKSLRSYVNKRRDLLIQIYKQKDFVQSFDSEFKSLEKEVADLEIDFTLPGHCNFELIKGGKDKLVTLENLDEYLRLIIEWTLFKGVQTQMESFKEGFESILPLSCLKQFYPEEMDRFFCGSGYKKWDAKSLVECTRCDHGYTHESKAVKFLFDVMCEFDSEEQRMFLQFVTGSPRLPIGGLSSLVPALTIVRKAMDSTNANADNYLPSVMTCVNYLKLPEYSSVNILKEKLFKAMKDGQLSFHLS
ncbi:unnamed protein product [Brachionus calyciflorus]|uniref:E3 ubiquitin-protein ligase n=1 Tax=Brachionus calyciflorus TaxID=104777 RepID=A0A813NU42_9BILA|nr:unnamed protein product [Brachionus calyciflorus]